MNKQHFITLFAFAFFHLTILGQANNALTPLKKYISKDSTSYISASAFGQFWGRYTEHNPGSLMNNEPINESFDVGIRRIRFVATAVIQDRFTFYTHIGLNNLSPYNQRKTGIFLHDATFDAKIYKSYFELGLGLGGWNGTSRFSASATSSILGVDLPLIQETTNDVTDQFGRKFGIYAKGKINKFDYRLVMAQPFPTRSALATVEQLDQVAINQSVFNRENPHFNYSGYFQYQILDQESNQTPYNSGSYLGKKRIVNVGTGFQTQKNAVWHRNTDLDTIRTNLFQFGLDVFVDYALNAEKQNAITFYAAYLHYNYGTNYIRNVGPLNIANGVNGQGSFNGPGNNLPLIGTGNVGYFQAAYKFKNNLLGQKLGTLQPYFIYSVADYQKLDDLVHVFHAGVNWLVIGQNVKISLDYQSRPVFNQINDGIHSNPNQRKSQLILQVQVAI